MTRSCALLVVLCLAVSVSVQARPGAPLAVTQAPEPGGLRNDAYPPQASSRSDTVWFGGFQESGPDSGTAYNSVDDGYDAAVWTWDAGTADPLEGWTTRDLTTDPDVYFGWVDDDSVCAPVWPEDPGTDANYIFPPVATNGEIWLGAHEAEAAAMFWELGLGYANYWCQMAYSPQYNIATNDAIEIRFKYFQDSEADFDYTHIHILTYDAAGTLLQTYEVGRLSAKVGTAAGPANYGPATVPYSVFSPAPAKVRLQFNFIADAGWSDQDGDYSCDYGPFAADDVHFKIGTTDHLYNFTGGPQAWTFEKCPGIGAYMNVCSESDWQGFILGPPAVRCPCDLSGNALYCATDIPTSPRPGHFVGHEELMTSSIVDREGFTSEAGYFNVVVRWDAFNFLRNAAGTFYRPGFYYYPFRTPEDPTPRWSLRSGQDVWHYTGQTPVCQNELFSLTVPPDGTPLPYYWEQMKYIFQVVTSCAGFGIPADDCRREGITNGAPVYDNVRVGITGGVNAPAIVLATGLSYHDGFGQRLPEFLDAGDVCDASVAFDLSRDNTDRNDWYADTAAVNGPPVTLPEYKYWIDLCFKVAKKGPRQDWITEYTAWKARLPGDPETGFVCALMDTAMFFSGTEWLPVNEGQARVTYFHENYSAFDDSKEDRTPEQEILPDHVFTPGTRIEYYYRSYWSQSPQGYFTIPADAPAVNVSEMEFLPMMELDILTPAEYDVIWPSVLYIDAVETPVLHLDIEAYITPVLDQEVGVGMYDKFDRQNFSSNFDAPLLRSFGRAFYDPGGYGNNGCTLNQLLGYRLILFNSGTYGIGAGEIEDFTILENWLTSIDCGLTSVRRGLVMNGVEIASIMADPTEGKAILFCNNTLGVTLTDLAYRDYNNDAYGCVWLPGATNNEFDPLAPIAVYGNGCPQVFSYNVLGVQAGAGAEGNLDFQPGAGASGYNYPLVHFSEVVKEENITTGGGWKSVVDGFSWHHLSEIGYGGEECSNDTVAVRTGFADLLIPELAWFLNDTRAQGFTKWNYPCTDVSVEDGETHLSGPVDFLYASRPNPFRGTATIRFTLASEGPVKIAIYDVSGRLVKTLLDGKAAAGENSLVWDGTDNAGHRVSDGIFWVDMATDRLQSAKRLVALR